MGLTRPVPAPSLPPWATGADPRQHFGQACLDCGYMNRQRLCQNELRFKYRFGIW